jgi:hypothetical protein
MLYAKQAKAHNAVAKIRKKNETQTDCHEIIHYLIDGIPLG